MKHTARQALGFLEVMCEYVAVIVSKLCPRNCM
jgi:hypothetical protein